jgi:hypothetical protein
MIEIRPNSKWKNVSFGMIPRMCRRHKLYRLPYKNVFVRHTVGVGGLYVYCNQETVRVRVDELGIDFTTNEIFKVRNILENMDRIEKRLTLEWKKVIESLP